LPQQRFCADLPVLTDRSNFTFEPKWLFRFLTRIFVKNPIHRSFLFSLSQLLHIPDLFPTEISGFGDSLSLLSRTSALSIPRSLISQNAGTASTMVSLHGYLLAHVTTIPYDRSPKSFVISGFRMSKRIDPLSSGFLILRIPIS
jgi:hypothetical protein